MVDFDRSMLGVESAPIHYDVEKGAIRKFVDAIGDADPIYRDEQAAQAAGFKTIVAPPTILCTFRAQELPDLHLVFGGRVRLNGGNAYEYHRPVYAGDTIRFTRTLKGIRALQSRQGWSMMQMSSAAYNQNGDKVLEFDSAALIALPD